GRLGRKSRHDRPARQRAGPSVQRDRFTAPSWKRAGGSVTLRAMTSPPILHNACALGLAAALLAGCATSAPPGVEPASARQPGTSTAAPAGDAARATDAPAGKEPGDAITIGKRRTIRSSILGEERTLLVYTPPS